ncbi:Uncharacterised protein [Flavonifractor plautii]|uniref:Uncharacterized protein n=1 Tax=Flavonifractor plautii TaxID=292800 RepID=A0A174J0G2_FLAPL|nr:Uncharacterised protein [Flavonifractor plautii]
MVRPEAETIGLSRGALVASTAVRATTSTRATASAAAEVLRERMMAPMRSSRAFLLKAEHRGRKRDRLASSSSRVRA